MHREIAVAFQGGGARLIGLIAAAHALSDMERNRDISIRAISGSSAGSIAAFLLASNANFDQVRDTIRQLEPRIRRSFPYISSRALYIRFLNFLLTGATIYKPERLKEIIELILSKSGIEPRKRIADLSLQKELFLMYSDIYSFSSQPAHESEVVSEALVKSCMLPIVFSSYKSAGSGQYVDGGILDNLPTEVLMKSQAEPYPVFAVGFKPDRGDTPNSPWSYLFTLGSSGIQYRIMASKKAIGEDMALELDTSIGTLDFGKIVNVGVEKEYGAIREQTRRFFQEYLSGHGQYTDPLSETRGIAPFRKLKSIEKQIYEYVYDSIAKAECTNRYLKTRVNAFSLANPNAHDEIIVEQLIEFPEGDYIKGAVLPMTKGAGYAVSIECHAYVGGPEGKEIRCEQFFINDNNSEIARMGGSANLVVLLFKGDLKRLIGQSVYIVKKEKRHGFMLDLADRKQDYLTIRSYYWPAREVTIILNVPRQFPQLRCEWLREEGAGGPPPVHVEPIQNLVPAGYVGYGQSLRDVGLGTLLKGNFYSN